MAPAGSGAAAGGQRGHLPAAVTPGGVLELLQGPLTAVLKEKLPLEKAGPLLHRMGFFAYSKNPQLPKYLPDKWNGHQEGIEVRVRGDPLVVVFTVEVVREYLKKSAGAMSQEIPGFWDMRLVPAQIKVDKWWREKMYHVLDLHGGQVVIPAALNATNTDLWYDHFARVSPHQHLGKGFLLLLSHLADS